MPALDEAAYMPSPEQIKAACAKIRAGWTDNTRRLRAPWAYAAEQVVLHTLQIDEPSSQHEEYPSTGGTAKD